MADRNRPQEHVARARLVLLSADRLDVAAIARRAGISRPAVWRWQRRYAEAGVDGLLRDKTRKPGKAPLGDGLVRRLVGDGKDSLHEFTQRPSRPGVRAATGAAARRATARAAC